jgi:hypothetical protein
MGILGFTIYIGENSLLSFLLLLSANIYGACFISLKLEERKAEIIEQITIDVD